MAMKIFTEPSVLGAADVNEYLVNTKYAAKPADTGRNNTTSMTSDPDLVLAVDTNKSYKLDLFLLYHSNGTANFKFAFNFPAGSIINGVLSYVPVGFSNIGFLAYGVGASTFAPGDAQHLGGADPFDQFAWLTGVLVTAGTAGNFAVKWAQDTSGGFNTRLMAGSWMLMKRVS